jgi:hypothetical protein
MHDLYVLHVELSIALTSLPSLFLLFTIAVQSAVSCNAIHSQTPRYA